MDHYKGYVLWQYMALLWNYGIMALTLIP